jgi:hypothetical protein
MRLVDEECKGKTAELGSIGSSDVPAEKSLTTLEEAGKINSRPETESQ